MTLDTRDGFHRSGANLLQTFLRYQGPLLVNRGLRRIETTEELIYNERALLPGKPLPHQSGLSMLATGLVAGE